MKKILIIGGLGYVGSSLVRALHKDFKVYISARHISSTRAEWLKSFPNNIEKIKYDSNLQSKIESQEKFDLVINLAVPSASEAASNEGVKIENSTKIVKMLISGLASGQFARIIHFSTFHVYGGEVRECYNEEDAVKPLHAYGRVHLACEKLFLESDFHRSVVILRASNIVGCPEHKDIGPQESLIYLDLCRQAAEQNKLALRSNGIAFRDILPMQALVSHIKNIIVKSETFGMFNLADGESTSLKSLAEQIQRESSKINNQECSLELGDGEDNFSNNFKVDVSKLHEISSVKTESMEDEIRKTVLFYMQNRK